MSEKQRKAEYHRQYRERNREQIKKQRRGYYELHHTEILTKGRKRYNQTKEELLNNRSRLNLARKLQAKHKVLTDYERGFLEGIIDGEGCLYTGLNSNGKTRLFNLLISMTNKEILEKTRTIIGEGIVRGPRSADRRGHRLPEWTYIASANTLRWLLPQLRLIVKEDKKEKILTALNLVMLTPRLSQKTPEYYKQLEVILT